MGIAVRGKSGPIAEGTVIHSWNQDLGIQYFTFRPNSVCGNCPRPWLREWLERPAGVAFLLLLHRSRYQRLTMQNTWNTATVVAVQTYCIHHVHATYGIRMATG
jgi:hypothetical protein